MNKKLQYTQRGTNLTVDVMNIRDLLVRLEKVELEWTRNPTTREELLDIDFSKSAPKSIIELLPYGRNGKELIQKELIFQRERLKRGSKSLNDLVFMVREKIAFGDRLFDLDSDGLARAQHMYGENFTSETVSALKKMSVFHTKNKELTYHNYRQKVHER